MRHIRLVIFSAVLPNTTIVLAVIVAITIGICKGTVFFTGFRTNPVERLNQKR